jgi:hypothetical protein
MRDDEGKEHILKRHELTHPEKTLGVLTAPDGSMIATEYHAALFDRRSERRAVLASSRE